LLSKVWKKRLQNAAYVIIGIVLPAVLFIRNLSSSGKVVVATVDGQEMLPDEVGIATTSVDPFDHSNPAHRQAAVRRAVEIRKLSELAVQKGLDKQEPWRSRIEQEEFFSLIMEAKAHMMSNRVQDSYLSDGEFREYVDKYRADLEQPDDVSIMLRIAHTDEDVKIIQERMAANVPLDEIPLAKERYGVGEFMRWTKGKFYSPAQIVDPKLRHEIWQVKVGERAGPIETPEGKFFIQMMARRPGKERSFESIHQQLYPSLSRRLYDQTLKQKMAELVDRFPAKIDEAALQKLRLGEEVDGEALVIELPGREVRAKRILEVSREKARENDAKSPIDAAVSTLLENNRMLLYARQSQLSSKERTARDILLWRQWVLYEAAIEDERARAKPTDADIEEGLKVIRDRFASDPMQLHLEALVLRNQETADRVLKLLKEGSTFESQAIHSAMSGGQTDLGWIWPWEFEPEVIQAFIKEPDNSIVGPVKSGIGFIVGRVIERRDSKMPDDAEVRALVTKSQTRRAQHVSEKKLRDEIWSKAKVKVDGDVLAKMWTGVAHFPGGGSYRLSNDKGDAGAAKPATPGEGQPPQRGPEEKK
jgi:parvulin-like peptidyl-prolyl isomerase